MKSPGKKGGKPRKPPLLTQQTFWKGLRVSGAARLCWQPGADLLSMSHKPQWLTFHCTNSFRSAHVVRKMPPDSTTQKPPLNRGKGTACQASTSPRLGTSSPRTPSPEGHYKQRPGHMDSISLKEILKSGRLSPRAGQS